MHLQAGKAIACPTTCPAYVFDMVIAPCFAETPAERPPFTTLQRFIRSLTDPIDRTGYHAAAGQLYAPMGFLSSHGSLNSNGPAKPVMPQFSTDSDASLSSLPGVEKYLQEQNESLSARPRNTYSVSFQFAGFALPQSASTGVISPSGQRIDRNSRPASIKGNAVNIPYSLPPVTGMFLNPLFTGTVSDPDVDAGLSLHSPALMSDDAVV